MLDFVEACDASTVVEEEDLAQTDENAEGNEKNRVRLLALDEVDRQPAEKL